MAAEIVSDVSDDGNPEIPVEKLEVAHPQPAEKDKPKGKFDGKTSEEVEAAYAALEQRFGQQGAELGELRKLTDGIIRSSLVPKKDDPASKQQQELDAVTDDDAEFFINPRAAIKKVLEQDETIKSLREHRAESQQDKAKRILKQKHEDADTLIQDKEFQEWVKASNVRTRLFRQAHEQLDVDVADELFTTFKALRRAKSPQTTSQAAGDGLVDAQKKAAGAPNGTTGAGETSKSKPVFSRRKIMDLMINNPDEYASRNDEFLAAYAEGRVRP